MFQGAIVTANSLIVNLDNQVYNVQTSHPNFTILKDAYKNGDCEAFIKAYDISEAVRAYVEDGVVKNSGVVIDGDRVLYNGVEVHNTVVEAIQRMLSEGFDIKPMANFLENMMKNPSYTSIKEMWDFIEAMGLTITEDGCFLAYKSVSADYRDKYSGTIDNTPGNNPPRLNRNQVDDNCNNHCSHGYHVGALGYAGPGGWYHSSGDKVLICKVNPEDVVSVPRDHSCQKLRCCYYEPVGEFKGQPKSSVYSGAVGDDYSSSPVSTNKFRPECIDGYDLLEDNYYIGEYVKRDGTCSTRFFLVEEVQVDAEKYVVLLIEPELNHGDHRSFNMSKLYHVYTWDGSTPPDQIDNPYADMYDDEDDEDDVCEGCGDCYCDGDCEDDCDCGDYF